MPPAANFFEKKFVKKLLSCCVLDSLPIFGEKDIINGSETMQYDWQILVLNLDGMVPVPRLPVNSLWQVNLPGDANPDRSGNGKIIAENAVTGEVREFKRSDFFGALRPEIVNNIDYDAIKLEF